MNLLTPDKVVRGIREVREGLTFNLSLPLDFPGGNVLNPRRLPPVLRPTLRNGKSNMNYQLRCDDPRCTDVISDDLAVLHLQYSTQWDSLAHVGSIFDAQGTGEPQAVYYNGFRAGIDVTGPASAAGAGIFDFAKVPRESTSGAKKLGIENMSGRCVQGRAVMIDLHAHIGRERVLVDHDLLRDIMQKDAVQVEPGDMVCLHTGFAEMILEMDRQPDAHRLENSCAVLEGRDARLLQWITDSGLVALIADNYAVEAYPASSHEGCCASLPVHEHCLFKLGVHLGELWHLTPLATWLRSHGRNRFLLTAPPLGCPARSAHPSRRSRRSEAGHRSIEAGNLAG